MSTEAANPSEETDAKTEEETKPPLNPEAEDARSNIEDLENSFKEVKSRLETISEFYREFGKCPIESANENCRGFLSLRKNFEQLGICFFVDFMIVPKGSSEDFLVEGRISYGAIRQTVAKHDSKDKILFECAMTQKGLIKDPGGLKGKWLIPKKGPADFKDLHDLIIASIWDSALNWVNEYPNS